MCCIFSHLQKPCPPKMKKPPHCSTMHVSLDFIVKTIQKYRKKPWNSTVCVQFSLFSYVWIQCRLSNINEVFSACMIYASVPHHSQNSFWKLWASAVCSTPTPKQFLWFIVKLLCSCPCVYFQVAALLGSLLFYCAMQWFFKILNTN